MFIMSCLSYSFTVYNILMVFFFLKVTQSCPTLCDPMDYIVHGILQALCTHMIFVVLNFILLGFKIATPALLLLFVFSLLKHLVFLL